MPFHCTRQITIFSSRWRHVKSNVMYGPALALVWLSDSPGLTETNTSGSLNLARSFFPLCVCQSVFSAPWLFLCLCEPQICRLMPCRTDRLNANLWMVTKPAPGSKLHMCVCVLYVCMCPVSYKSMPVCLLEGVNIKQLPSVNNSKGHCKFQIVYILLSYPDETGINVNHFLCISSFRTTYKTKS